MTPGFYETKYVPYALVFLILIGSSWIRAQDTPEKILLKDYQPKAIYKIPISEVSKARYAVIDMHSHAYAKTPDQIDAWVRIMDEVGIEKTVILSGAVGKTFDDIYRNYAKYPGRFDIWCGVDYTDLEQSGAGTAAVRELERCRQVGAKGVGELVDKGKGVAFRQNKALRLHPDDPRLDPIWKKCAEWKMPVNLHVADPIWMYEPMDAFNDGLMNAYEWRLDNQPDIVGHSGMIDILEKTVKRHPSTIFIASHFANLCYDLERMGRLLDQYPNLYADISARYAETAPIPRFTNKFYQKYADRLVYGTDMGYRKSMYQITFRILETQDEHFYEQELFGYHWALNGLALPDSVLRKVYRDNACKILGDR